MSDKTFGKAMWESGWDSAIATALTLVVRHNGSTELRSEIVNLIGRAFPATEDK